MRQPHRSTTGRDPEWSIRPIQWPLHRGYSPVLNGGGVEYSLAHTAGGSEGRNADVGKRATRKTQGGDGIRDLEVDALKAENLHLKEEIERLRLRNAGAHPAAALADALQSSDGAADSADDALTMYASSMVIRSELIELLALFKSTIHDYERRLEMLTESPSVTAAETTDTADEADEDADDEAEELVAEADDEIDLADETDDQDTDDEDTADDADELVAEADDDTSGERDDEAEAGQDAVTIDLRDKERAKDRDKDKVKAVNGSRRNGRNNRGRDRQHDEDTAPAAKGA